MDHVIVTLTDHCLLSKHEMVQELEIRAELPKTPIGKLSKKELVDEEARKRQAQGGANA